MSAISSKPVSARVLDAAIAWQLSLDSGDGNFVAREEFAKWLASDEEHARAWRQLGMLDQRFSVATGPARAALLQSRAGIAPACTQAGQRLGKSRPGVSGWCCLPASVMCRSTIGWPTSAPPPASNAR